MRRSIVKFIILGALLLFTPISLMLGRRWRARGIYQWKDTPGENIPLPEEVSGQLESAVCVTSDGKFIVVVGHPFVPPDILERKSGVEPAIRLLCYKYFVCASQKYGQDFDIVYRSLRSGGVASMALSPVNPHRLAFIAVEFQKAVPDKTASEIMQMLQNKKELAVEYAEVLAGKDLDIVVYLLDIDKKEPPKVLCTLDNFPYNRMLKRPKTDLSGYSEFGKRIANLSKVFRDTGVVVEWQMRLSQEMQARSITWLPDGTALLVSDGYSITKIDLSGNKHSLYTCEDQCVVFGNITCRANGDILFVEVNHSGVDFSSKKTLNSSPSVISSLVRLDTAGKVLSKTQGVFSNSRCPFDSQPSFPLVGETKIAVTANKLENMHGAYLRTSALSPNLDDWKEIVDWKDHAKTYDIYDPNRVQFYYIPGAFIDDEDSVLLFKRRARAIRRRKPEDHPNWEATPYTAENAAAPWVELRKMKIS